MAQYSLGNMITDRQTAYNYSKVLQIAHDENLAAAELTECAGDFFRPSVLQKQISPTSPHRKPMKTAWKIYDL